MSSIERNIKDVNVNGVLLSFNYLGGEPGEIVSTSVETIDSVVQKFIYNLDHNDICRDVRFLRTIFRDYPLIKLSVTYRTEKTLEIAEVDGDKKDYSSYFSYEFWKANDNNELIKYIDFKGDLDKFTDLLIEVSWDKKINMSGLEPIEINSVYGQLIEVYRLFYGENPDFTDENLNLRCQAMLAVIKYLDYYALTCYDPIVKSRRQDYPSSRYVQEVVDELFPFGVVTEDIDGEIIKSEKNPIAEVGYVVRQYIERSPDKRDALMSICNILYAFDYKIDPFYYFDKRKQLGSEKNISNSEMDRVFKMLIRVREIDDYKDE